MRATRLVLGMSLLAGCGRFGFDEMATDAVPSDSAPGDATAATARGVAAGRAHSCAILDGRLSCWGANGAGQLGVGDMAERLVPTAVAPGTLWLAVTCGGSHTCAIREDASLWCWGDNANGQLGIVGSPLMALIPTQVSLATSTREVATRFDSTCAVLVDGSLWCWGVNSEGQLAQDNFVSPINSPVRVGTGSGWSTAAVGQGHMIAIANGTANGSGRNAASELGLGIGAPAQTRTIRLIDPGPWRYVSAGQQSSMAIRSDGTLWGWGGNGASVLGFPTGAQRDLPEIVDGARSWLAVDLDTFNGCGIAAPGAMLCWGRNVEGQLGRGDNIDAPMAAPSGTFTDWQSLAVARFHSCAQRTDGTVWCTGDNGTGELGVGDRSRRNAWTQVTLP